VIELHHIGDGRERSAFTRDQIARLQDLLCLSSYEHAILQSYAISAVLYLMPPFLAVKDKRHDEKARRRLDRIARLSRELANLLEYEPTASVLTEPEGLEWNDRYVSEVREERDRERDIFIRRLRQIEDRSLRLLDNRSYRFDIGLVPDRLAKLAPEVALLWPSLFRIWEECGREPAKTEGGPLHSFVNLVHEVLGLEPAAYGTFRDAVDRWNKEKAGTGL